MVLPTTAVKVLVAVIKTESATFPLERQKLIISSGQKIIKSDDSISENTHTEQYTLRCYLQCLQPLNKEQKY